MIQINKFSNIDLDNNDKPLPKTDSSPFQSDYMQLLFEGDVVNSKMEGCIIVAQFIALTGHYILFVELGWEILLIYLLNESFQLLETTGLNVVTCDGSFTAPEIVNDNTINFTFYTDERWSLTFYPNKRRIRTNDQQL